MDKEAHERLVQLLPPMGRTAEAVLHLQALAESAPNEIGRWIRLAKMLSELGDTGRERDAWLGALAAGESLAARARLVDLFLAEGNTGDAIPHMRALAESNSDQAEHWTRLAGLHRQVGDAAGEAETWLRLLTIANDKDARVRLAKLLPALGREAEAVPHYRALTRMAPDEPRWWQQLARHLKKSGETAGEAEAWDHVLRS